MSFCHYPLWASIPKSFCLHLYQTIIKKTPITQWHTIEAATFYFTKSRLDHRGLADLTTLGSKRVKPKIWFFPVYCLSYLKWQIVWYTISILSSNFQVDLKSIFIRALIKNQIIPIINWNTKGLEQHCSIKRLMVCYSTLI